MSVILASLKRLSICPCGYAVLDDSIQLGVKYRLDPDSVQEGFRYRCGRCGKSRDDVTVVNASAVLNPGAPLRPLPLDLFRKPGEVGTLGAWRMTESCGPLLQISGIAAFWFNIAVCIYALWTLARPRFRRTYHALSCRRHGLFNADGCPFCPVCGETLQPLTLYRRSSRKRPHTTTRRNPIRRSS